MRQHARAESISKRAPSTTRTSHFRVCQKARLRAPHGLVDKDDEIAHAPLLLTAWRSLGALPPPLSLRGRARFACPRRKAPQGATQSATKARRLRASSRRASFLALIRFRGRVAYALGLRSVIAEDDACGSCGNLRSLQISTGSTRRAARFSNSAGLIWPSVECRRRWL